MAFQYLSSSQKTVTELVERALKWLAPKEYAARAAAHRHELVQHELACCTATMTSNDRIPVFVCTTSFPCVACPLFVFEPRYRTMVRWCLETGARQFGIAACLNRQATGHKRYYLTRKPNLVWYCRLHLLQIVSQ